VGAAAYAATGRFFAAPTLDLVIHVRRPLHRRA
jgi:hypothetical protein